MRFNGRCNVSFLFCIHTNLLMVERGWFCHICANKLYIVEREDNLPG
jgi:hypothetical protein